MQLRFLQFFSGRKRLHTETHSSIYRENEMDHLSELPDDILCYILSFLETKEASITCLLSKRWQSLWTKVPVLLFKVWNTEGKHRFVNRINRTLSIYSGHSLERFEIDLIKGYKECFASDINVWIEFAVKKNVKQFVLLLRDTKERHYLPEEHHHMLPETMYFNPSWTSLTLAGCFMAPQGSIQWRSLKKLCLFFVDLDESTLQKIFLGCPLLSNLDLVRCLGFHRLEVNSPSLCMLTIDDDFTPEDDDDDDDFTPEDDHDEENLEICAPYLHTLKIHWDCEYKNLCLKNMKSLVRAELNDTEREWEATEHCKKRIKDLFESIRNVKMLQLGPEFTKNLSLIGRNLQLPQSTRRCLELHVFRNKRSIPGIALLLESSPDLEKLVIHGHNSYLQHIPANTASKDDLDCDLFNLKTVRFKNFGDSDLDTGEPMLTLARILLKRTIFLQKMVVESTTSSTPPAFYEVVKKLYSYPRFFEKGVILFC